MNQFVSRTVTVANAQSTAVGDVHIVDNNYAITATAQPVFQFGQTTGNPRTVPVRYSGDIEVRNITSAVKRTHIPYTAHVQSFLPTSAIVVGRTYTVHIYRPHTRDGFRKGKDFVVTARNGATLVTVLVELARQINEDTEVFDYAATVDTGTGTLYVYNSLNTQTLFNMTVGGEWLDLAVVTEASGSFGVATFERVATLETEYKEAIAGTKGNWIIDGFKDRPVLVATNNQRTLGSATLVSAVAPNSITFAVAPLLPIGSVIYLAGSPLVVLDSLSPTTFVVSANLLGVLSEVASAPFTTSGGYTIFAISHSNVYDAGTSSTVQNFTRTVALSNFTPAGISNAAGITAFQTAVETVMSRPFTTN